ncbi:Unannotated [Lentimonas sp. CC19]|nr:Unannotated [Lentimonas sp. CC10]CAA6697654.1 Unannotated [Lentimonas sp. CC19]CAA7071486.1 Unannotated [Lentimonas sp. CC11]
MGFRLLKSKNQLVPYVVWQMTLFGCVMIRILNELTLYTHPRLGVTVSYDATSADPVCPAVVAFPK